MPDDLFPIIVLLGIIAIALFGGTKTAGLFAVESPATATTQTLQNSSPSSTTNISAANQISLQWGSYTSNPNEEYLDVTANTENTAPIDITGWKLTNTLTGFSVTIPQSTDLYFANEPNSNEDVWLAPGETAYIITGRSPIGYGFRANICSGYLSQNNQFSPYLYTSCPTPQQESVTLQASVQNNNCFDLIAGTPACTTHTQALNNTYSEACQQLFATTLTYQGCVTNHKNDSDFYSPAKWYVYLNRDDGTLWNVDRESVTLTNLNGNIVSTISR